MNKLYILTLEKLQQRYTSQWYTYFKKEFSKYYNVVYIDGNKQSTVINKGRFLDICNTNIWKSEQVIKISQLLNQNKIKDGDKIFFMDAWHPGIINIKYMVDLLQLKVKLYGYLHAGAWDYSDMITQYGFRKWCIGFEVSMFKCLDKVFVATNYHKELIVQYFKNHFSDKIYVVGFPMDWKKCINDEEFSANVVYPKDNLVVFPHRLDKEKQPQSFDELKDKYIDFKFIKTMQKTKTKKQYYNLIKNSKVCFSDSLQETFGIGTVECLMFNCIPLVPDRLSYVELYDRRFRYSSKKERDIKLYHFMLHYYDKDIQQLIKINKEFIIKQSLDSIKKMSVLMK